MEQYQNIEVQEMGWNGPKKECRLRIKDRRFGKIIYIKDEGDLVKNVETFLKEKGYIVLEYSANIDNTYTFFVRTVNGGFAQLTK